MYVAEFIHSSLPYRLMAPFMIGPHRMQRAAAAAVAVTALALFATAPRIAAAQEIERNAFSFSQRLDAGRTVHVRNINGAIAVERSTSGQVEVSADKRWRRGDPDKVRIVQVTARDGGIMVCALWNDSECTDDGIRGNSSMRNGRDNDVSVQFTVRVPEGVHVNMQTINGSVEIDDVSGMIEATTVNGSIEAYSTGGPVRAQTVNGSIKASMRSFGNEDVRYSTVNGGISLELPRGSNADLDISTMNGSIETDFPVTVQGSISRKRLRGTIGSGGPELKATTVNGSVTLTRGR